VSLYRSAFPTCHCFVCVQIRLFRILPLLSLALPLHHLQQLLLLFQRRSGPGSPPSPSLPHPLPRASARDLQQWYRCDHGARIQDLLHLPLSRILYLLYLALPMCHLQHAIAVTTMHKSWILLPSTSPPYRAFSDCCPQHTSKDLTMRRTHRRKSSLHPHPLPSTYLWHLNRALLVTNTSGWTRHSISFI